MNDYPHGHMLHGVPDDILDSARKVLCEAAIWGDIDDEYVEPIADAVVIALLPYLCKHPICTCGCETDDFIDWLMSDKAGHQGGSWSIVQGYNDGSVHYGSLEDLLIEYRIKKH